MKNKIVFGLLIALICFILCGCTSNEVESSSSDVNLPTLITEHTQFPDGTAGSEKDPLETQQSTLQLETETVPGVEVHTPGENNTNPPSGKDGTPEPTYNSTIGRTEHSDPAAGSEEDLHMTVDSGENIDITVTSGETSGPGVDPVEDPDEETVSEFVVDGGDDFGFGGN